jgi:hypothetical protein
LAEEKKQKEAYTALAEKYRAAAGEAFKDTKPEKTDELSADKGGEKEKKFTDYGVNQRALDELKNI